MPGPHPGLRGGAASVPPAVEGEINDRCGEQSEQLAHDQAAHDGDAQRTPELGSRAVAQHQRQRTEQRRHGGHQDRPKPQERCPGDRLARREALLALRVQGEIDHHDGVFLDDADQQDDADDAEHVQIVAGDDQSQHGADACRRERRKNGDRMDEALVEDAEHDVHGDDRRPEAGAPGWSGRAGRPQPCPGKPSRIGRQMDVLLGLRMASTAAPSEEPGARLNEMVVAETARDG